MRLEGNKRFVAKTRKSYRLTFQTQTSGSHRNLRSLCSMHLYYRHVTWYSTSSGHVSMAQRSKAPRRSCNSCWSLWCKNEVYQYQIISHHIPILYIIRYMHIHDIWSDVISYQSPHTIRDCPSLDEQDSCVFQECLSFQYYLKKATCTAWTSVLYYQSALPLWKNSSPRASCGPRKNEWSRRAAKVCPPLARASLRFPQLHTIVNPTKALDVQHRVIANFRRGVKKNRHRGLASWSSYQKEVWHSLATTNSRFKVQHSS